MPTSPLNPPASPHLPDSMGVIDTSGPGDTEVLVDAKRPLPQPAKNQVLIEVAAAGVNGPDLVQRRGHYPPPAGASELLGLEVAGRIVGLGEGVGDSGGEGVAKWRVGDEVVALTNGGGYAEYVAVDAGHCLPLPEGVGLVDGAGLPECYFTVWSNVWHTPFLPSDTQWRMLVHGGSGGIGSVAIQLGAALGGEVFATVGNKEAAAWCEGLGARRVINYKHEDFVAVTREAGGADVILDIIGGGYVARNIKAAKPGGRIIQLAFNQGSKLEIDLMPVMLKRLVYTGATLRSRPAGFKTAVAVELREKVWPLFAQPKSKPKLTPTTYTSLPLTAEGAREAHRLLEAGGHRGKIVLVKN